MTPPIDQYKRRATQYWNVDGLAEITVGAIFLGLGLFYFAISLSSSHRWLAFLLQLAVVLIIIGGSFGGRKLTERLKESITYPRTGYVAYRPPTRKTNIIVATFALGLMILIFLLSMTNGNRRDLSVLADGLILCPLIIIIGKGIRRFFLLSGLALAAGLGLFLLGMQGYLGHSLFYGLVGLAFLASGGWTLRNYLHQNTSPEETL